MSLLYDFLQKNSINSSEALPLVHTTRAQYLSKLLDTNTLKASECDVFRGENLNYFFVGRPAYKFELTASAEYWELPICFIMNYDVIDQAKRVFPFDSGGFKNKAMPSFITSHDLNEFEISKDSEAAKKIIGTFFGNTKNYFKLKGRENIDFSSYHDISMLDTEIQSIHKLSMSGAKGKDDRNFSIEAQIEGDVELSPSQLMAVIVPDPYLEDYEFLSRVTDNWTCDLLSYDVYPLNPDTFYYAIYNQVETYFRDKGFF